MASTHPYHLRSLGHTQQSRDVQILHPISKRKYAKTGPPLSQPKPHTRNTCESCRTDRRRCNRLRPQCGHCKESQIDCLYEDSHETLTPVEQVKKQIRRLNGQMEQVKEQMQRLNSHMEQVQMQQFYASDESAYDTEHPFSATSTAGTLSFLGINDLYGTGSWNTSGLNTGGLDTDGLITAPGPA
ncbi:hypothetical protein K458DRAFT_407121 [Lentithecium fluviatile CBS 122367]|uniref:Zn(2)-C6 fungal-type domain-containing protein n=1 Tax=Lentithecium fluviatile CBS 122367 TaxID=1168545 RepID=A0A6G1IRP4_9PLEO|nr:hypothetical protein K458DRAFT_407121 [Lentithecium fluviatile CBS 122367]